MQTFFKLFIATHVALFRLTGGKFGGSIRSGKILLLTTTGRKTGLKRTVPVMYIEDAQGNPVVTGSNNGAPTNPAWFENLRANPAVTYELGRTPVAATGVVAEPALRDSLWKTLTAKHAGFLEYEKKTTRTIPMVVLKAAR